MKHKIILTLLLLVPCIRTMAQDVEKDNPFGADDATTARYYAAQQQVANEEAFMLFVDSLQKEAIEEDNMTKKIMSVDLMAFFYFVRGDSTVVKYLKEALAITKELGKYHSYTSYLNNLGAYYLNSGQFYKALEIANTMITEAKTPYEVCGGHTLSGAIYAELCQRQQAIKEYKEAIKVFEESERPLPLDHKTNVLVNMAIELKAMANYEECEKYLKELDELDSYRVETPYLRALICFDKHDKEGFNKQYEKLKNLPPSRQGNNQEYLATLNIYKLAIDGRMKEAVEIATTNDNFNIVNTNNLLISLYKWAGEWKKSLDLVEENIMYFDSINTAQAHATIASMSAEMRTIYETYEKEQQILRQRYTMWIGYIILAAVLIFTGILVYRNVEINKKNRALVVNINELLNSRKREQARLVATHTQLAAEKATSTEENSEDAESEEERQTAQVHRFIYELTSRKLFCNADFDRDTLLEELHIRKTGFPKAFELITGTNTSRYIQDLRLEAAAEQIREHPEYSIEAIAADCGIPNRASFYRLFTARFGITPGIFREQCKQTEN